MSYFGWVVVIVVALVLYSKLTKSSAKNQNQTPQINENEIADNEKNTNEEFNDEFLNKINKQKVELEEEVKRETKAHQVEMHKKYSDDLKLKEALSKFATDHELDQALIALWEEVKYYGQYDKNSQLLLELENIQNKGEDHKDKQISFTWKNDKFTIKYHKSSSFVSNDENIDFTLTENGEDKFKINTSHPFTEFGDTYNCFSIDMFKKNGNWADFLLYAWRWLKIKNSNMHEDFKYIGAEEIKKKFER